MNIFDLFRSVGRQVRDKIVVALAHPTVDELFLIVSPLSLKLYHLMVEVAEVITWSL